MTMRTIVVDTNVLLADPAALDAFPDTEVIVPETVLAELDKLKTSRIDPDLRFRGREVSRLLFELSEQGKLADGVELPEGGLLRVVGVDTDAGLPEGLSLRNADDRILAVALTLRKEGVEDVTLVTNDLNMLLKAQNLGLRVERHADGAEGSFGRRFIVRPFQRYKIPIGILSVALAVFAAIVLLTVYNPRPGGVSSVPAEFREILTTEQQTVLDYLFELERGGSELDTHLQLANSYFRLQQLTGEFKYSRLAVRHFEAYLNVKPNATEARTDLAASYWLLGQTDRAIRETQTVLEREPQHLQANFNLGIFYWQGRRDYAAAYAQFRKVSDLARSGNQHEQMIGQNAEKNIEAIRVDAEKAGQKLDAAGRAL